MTSAENRKKAIKLIDEARKNGAWLGSACELVGISERTYQRWVEQGPDSKDKRPSAKRRTPANKLNKEERAQVLKVCNSTEFADLSPTQIVPKLADKGKYIASESTMYRIFKEKRQNARRTTTKRPNSRPIETHVATRPNQVWLWDITWLPGPVKGIYFKLYMIMDIFSRFTIGWEVHDEELTEHAKKLVKKHDLSMALLETL